MKKIAMIATVGMLLFGCETPSATPAPELDGGVVEGGTATIGSVDESVMSISPALSASASASASEVPATKSSE